MILDKYYKVGKIDERIYGSFIEHLGQVVYGGIYEPWDPMVDDKGFRKYDIELVRKFKGSNCSLPRW